MFPVFKRSMVNVNMHRDPIHTGVMDYVVANKRFGFGKAVDYSDPSVEKDVRYNIMKRAPNLDYQGDAVSIGQFPGTCYS